jgi:DUF4097 and DUF4098 domain-containing protein YvlB
MPTYDTPGPIAAVIDIASGDVLVSAGDRDATVVDVRPADPSSAADRRAAELTHVERVDDHVVVKGPKSRSWPGRDGGSVDVSIELPSSSDVTVTAGVGDVQGRGRLGTCRIKTGKGRVALERAGTLVVKTGAGDVSVDHATGDVNVALAQGDVRLGELDGTAVVKTAKGDAWIGTAGSDLRVTTAQGNVAVDRSRSSVGAKTAQGDLRLREAVRGSVVLETHQGDVEVGVPQGTAAHLNVRALTGYVRNELDAVDGPAANGERVEIRARTTAGDVVIRRSA